jgi:sentrin-specific protease 7
VKRWTEKKGIDIFDKKFIFIPINKTLHWSLCIVVNPGAIIEHNKWHAVDFNKEAGDFDARLPCIIFLDSFKAHQKAQVAKNVRDWLNAEWKRLGKSHDPALAPFTAHKNSMAVYTPQSKYAYISQPIY